MRRPTGFQRVRVATQAIGAAALLITVALPHHHHDGQAAQPAAHSCRACKIQDGFSAATPDSQALPVLPVLVVRAFWPAHESPRAARVLRCAAPRAPPLLS